MIIGGYYINERYVTAEVTVNEAGERMVHMRRTPDPDFVEPPCPKCGAGAGEHCITASGSKRGRHAGRHDRLDYRRRLVDDRRAYRERHGRVKPEAFENDWYLQARSWIQRDPFGEAVAIACDGAVTVEAPSLDRLRYVWEYRVDPSVHGAVFWADVADSGGRFRWRAMVEGYVRDAGYAPTLDKAQEDAETAIEAVVARVGE